MAGVSPVCEGKYDFRPSNACDKLAESLRARQSSASSSASGGGPASTTKDEHPLIILAFDEAQTLSTKTRPCAGDWDSGSDPNWTNISELHHVLRGLRPLPVFSLFLSTSATIQPAPAPAPAVRAGDHSVQIVLRRLDPVPPYAELGFDFLADRVNLSGEWGLERVAGDGHVVRLGQAG